MAHYVDCEPLYIYDIQIVTSCVFIDIHQGNGLEISVLEARISIQNDKRIRTKGRDQNKLTMQQCIQTLLCVDVVLS